MAKNPRMRWQNFGKQATGRARKPKMLSKEASVKLDKARAAAKLPTEKQLAYLRYLAAKNDLKPPRPTTKALASYEIDRLKRAV